MVSVTELWLAILLAAVAVFVISSLLHMVIPIHKGDYRKLPGEAKVLAAMREQGVTPGNYMFPCAGSMQEMGSPEMLAKFQQGPVGFMTVRPSGTPGIGKSLGQWFAFCILVGVVVAYVAGLVLGPGADGMKVFRVTATIGLLGYGVSHVTDSIWKGVSWTITAKFLFDGLLYGLATGAIFAWLWPAGT